MFNYRKVESAKSQSCNRDTGFEMESSHSLILNEDAFKQIPDHKKPVYIFEWLRYLDKGLVAAQKVLHIVLLYSCDMN